MTAMMLRVARLAIPLVALGLAPWAHSEATEPDATESAGAIQLTDEKVLNLVGIPGQTIFQTGDAREIQFTSVKSGDETIALPLSVWIDENGVTLKVPEGQSAASRILRITLPPGLDVKVNTEDAAIIGSGLTGKFTIKGPRVAVDIRGLNGDIVIDSADTRLRIESITGDASIRARDTQTVANTVHGLLSIRAVRGTLSANGAHGLDVDLDSLASKFEGVEDPARIRAKGGSIALALARHGGTITLAGTTLKLDRCGGLLTVESDTSVEFKDCKADLRLEGDAASLRGERNTGSIEVRSSGAAIGLANISGPLRVEGDTLDVKIERLAGDLTVRTANSALSVTDVSGVVEVDNDGGNVSLLQAPGPIKVGSRGGDVTITQATSLVVVAADGGTVDVAWVAMSFEGKSELRNSRGVVIAHFPRSGGARIDATSEFGSVESGFPKIVVSPDRHKAQGEVGSPGSALVSIVAERDVQLLGDEAPRGNPEGIEP